MIGRHGFFRNFGRRLRQSRGSRCLPSREGWQLIDEPRDSCEERIAALAVSKHVGRELNRRRLRLVEEFPTGWEPLPKLHQARGIVKRFEKRKLRQRNYQRTVLAND